MFGGTPADRLWVEKYRPQSVNDYVFKNEALKLKVQDWIATGNIPHILLHGPAGTGKTSLINVLMHEIGTIDESDVMELNMSEAGMDDIREKVLPFCQTISFGSYKVIILEEFEQCSQKGQGSMKRIMEEYSDVARFIITSNAPNKILPPIRSRCQEVVIEKHNQDQFITRILEILMAEGVDVGDEQSLGIVDKYVRACWPDFRKCINTIQSQVINGQLIELNDEATGSGNYELQIIEALKTGTLTQTRKSIVENITDDMVDGFFSYLYRNVDIWVPTGLAADKVEEMSMRLILKVRDAMVNDTLVADREINMSACLIEMQLIQLEYL
ncbi:P-loop containing nucleoside triphosphate hydrolase [Vibrio phage 2.275.O._10N.286.54.E11]|nr:P-loop containing nucleoside triphosphate hydrolase [Vibrio phage 2.275.O._10N.286.54.E11]